METYERLLKKTKEMIQFQTGLGIIRWDLQTYMPPKGMKQRSEQLALMSKLLHRMVTDEEVQKIVSKLEKESDNLSPVQKREVELTRRMLDHRVNIPEELVSQETAQRTLTTAAWKKAKDTNTWKLFESELVTLLDISRSIADIMMDSTGAKCQLDALMDVWEPRMTTESVSKVFKDLRAKLVPLVKKYSSACEDVRVDFKRREVSVSHQQRLLTNQQQNRNFR